MDVNRRSDGSKLKQPLGVFRAQIDAAVAHWRAKIIMPVCAVQPVAVVEIHGIGHIGQVIPRPGHIGIFVLYRCGIDR